MSKIKVVLDTNVIFAGLDSNSGASHKLLYFLEEGVFENNVSTPLILEYEATLKKKKERLGLSVSEIEKFVDYICSISSRRKVFFLWRPTLNDPNDEMVLEVAVASRVSFIITFNKRDFVEAPRFGIVVLNPSEFLKILEVKK
jgi:putative PIN family toxin of toxin-antitoxin system